MAFFNLQRVHIMATKNDYMLKLAGYAVTVFVTIVITMTGFWMMVGRDFVTKSEVDKMIDLRVTAIEQREEKFDKVIEKNTEAIQRLEIQIAILNKTLELRYDAGKD